MPGILCIADQRISAAAWCERRRSTVWGRRRSSCGRSSPRSFQQLVPLHEPPRMCDVLAVLLDLGFGISLTGSDCRVVRLPLFEGKMVATDANTPVLTHN